MPGARANQFRGGDRLVSFVQDRATWTDFSQGSVQPTGNPLDVAISGNAFLTVQTPRGERYTRNGALQINSQGQLVTSEGLQVIGTERADRVPAERSQHLDRHRRHDLGARGPEHHGRAARQAQACELRCAASPAEGRHLDLHGARRRAARRRRRPCAVTQGAIEKSNVHSVIEMTRMVEITRTYTQIAQILQNHSDMRRTAIEKLSEVPTS